MKSRLSAALAGLARPRRRPRDRSRRRLLLRVVTVRPGASRAALVVAGRHFPCALGRNGTRQRKCEGDGRTPAGTFPLRALLYRPDRVRRPAGRLPAVPLAPGDGWCDAAGARAYNRPVSRPSPERNETLWRDDGLYDLVVVIGHNDMPVIPGAGSAIFLHVATPDLGPTEGCIALRRPDIARIVGRLGPGTRIAVGTNGAQRSRNASWRTRTIGFRR